MRLPRRFMGLLDKPQIGVARPTAISTPNENQFFAPYVKIDDCEDLCTLKTNIIYYDVIPYVIY